LNFLFLGFYNRCILDAGQLVGRYDDSILLVVLLRSLSNGSEFIQTNHTCTGILGRFLGAKETFINKGIFGLLGPASDIRLKRSEDWVCNLPFSKFK
jgi:hypothetical protein